MWIIRNQLGRRNLSALDKVALARQLRPLLEAQARAREQAGVRVDPVPNLEQGHGKVLHQIADIAGVSNGTAHAIEKILDHGAPEVIQATRVKDLAVSAAVELTELPKEQQIDVLAEARKLAKGKGPTAQQVKTTVKKAQVVATLKEHLAAGVEPAQAVKQAMQEHNIVEWTAS